MQEMNIPVVLMTALIPMLMGFIWYNPKVLGTAWMREAGITEESMKGAKMLKIFGVSLLFSFFLAAVLQTIVIHQFHLASLIMNEPDAMNPDSPAQIWLREAMSSYGNNFKTFKHGAFHGALTGILMALPILGINALFERKSMKYIFLNAGYWIITFSIMGGVLCQFSK
jgi:hypothetical protein